MPAAAVVSVFPEHDNSLKPKPRGQIIKAAGPAAIAKRRKKKDPPRSLCLYPQMDIEMPDLQQKAASLPSSASCSICLELVLDQAGRSTAKLHCGHEFHLDCIGSAFNAKGAMQCPNCRKIEKGRWLYANGQRSSADLDIDGLITEDFYDLISYPDSPFALQWCPFRGFTQLGTFLEEREPQPNSYNEPTDSTVYGDYLSGSRSANGCPYLALHAFPHAMQLTLPNSRDYVLDNDLSHGHPTSLRGQASADMVHSHSSATDLRNHDRLLQSFPFPPNSDQLASQSRVRASRNDTNSQQRRGSFMHILPVHGSVSHGQSVGAPDTMEVSGSTRGHVGNMYQQSAPSALRNPSFAPVRRTRPRGSTLTSSVATPSSAGVGGFYGLSASGSVHRNHQDGENLSRHIDHNYGWDREGFSSLPWIPFEGESQLWSPFNPNLNPTSYAQRTDVNRVTQNHHENDYQHMPPPGMPPFI